MTVTRTELAAHLGAAFNHGPASRDNLLAYAVGSHARPEIIAMISGMPDRRYPDLAALWRDLAGLAVAG